jgi:hypothetical protein
MRQASGAILVGASEFVDIEDRRPSLVPGALLGEEGA